MVKIASALVTASVLAVASLSSTQANQSSVTFPPPSPLIDPTYYKKILSDYESCKHHKCNILSKNYSSDIKTALSVAGAYTSCVTACAAAEMMRTMSDFKNLLGVAFDIGRSRLALAREHLAGTKVFDPLTTNTRIDESCCLPDDYFVSWDRIMINVAAMNVFPNDSTIAVRQEGIMIPVSTYVEACLLGNSDAVLARNPWLKFVTVDCKFADTQNYLRRLEANLAHLILAPKADALAPDNACTTKYAKNPRATPFPSDVCVATECVINGEKSIIGLPVLKELAPGGTCASDMVEADGSTVELIFKRVARAHLNVYGLTTGLPMQIALPNNANSVEQAYYNALANNDPSLLPSCENSGGLGSRTASYFTPFLGFSSANFPAVNECPLQNGLMEYCNMGQYTSWLQKQLFDNSLCNLEDIEANYSDGPQVYETLACLYKVTALKCDCMEAVLNCYKHEQSTLSEDLASALGRAASILCGFLLCQQPKVYTFFGGEPSINKARIMRGLLAQVNMATPLLDASASPATLAFLSFGVGMVAFVITQHAVKKWSPKRAVQVEDGYQNLL